jgi:magnesium transporter
VTRKRSQHRTDSGQMTTANQDKDRKQGVLTGFHRSTGVGAMPGSIDSHTASGNCKITRLVYSRNEVIEETLNDVTQLAKVSPDSCVTWIRIEGIPDAPVLRTLATVFGIHSLALEDVTNTHQRCKVEDYDEYLFVITRLPRYQEDGTLVSEQVALFLGRSFVISLHEGENIFNAVRDRIIRALPRRSEMPADYLGYAILDTATDYYFPVIEEIGNRLNAVDDQIESGVSHEQRSEIRQLRSDLLLVRRTIWPQRDAMAALMRDDCKLISPTTRTYLRDCYDHTVQILDVTETYRELCADLRDFHLAEISYRNNEVMKTLTIIATLFMPLSFVAGFYGMNFEYMPELHWRFGYPMVVTLMFTIAASLIYWFRRKGWLS